MMIPVRLLTLIVTVFTLAGLAQRPAGVSPTRKSRLVLLGEWPVAVKNGGPAIGPHEVAADRDGFVYVTDPDASMLHKFSQEGAHVQSIRVPGAKAAYGVAIGPRGEIVVAANDILVLSPDGKLVRRIRTGPGRAVEKPLDVVLDSRGNVFVSEHYGGIIHKLSPHGRLLRSWGGYTDFDKLQPGEFHHVLGMGFDPHGLLYVADINGGRIQKFTSDGRYVTSWKQDLGHGMVVSTNLIFLLNSVAEEGVDVLTLDGKLLFSDLEGRVTPSNTNLPRAAWNPKGELLILTTRGTVQRYRVEIGGN